MRNALSTCTRMIRVKDQPERVSFRFLRLSCTERFAARCLLAFAAFGLFTALTAAQTFAQLNTQAVAQESVFRRENLVAWCIVPFDSKKRNPEQRAAMLEKMGVKQLAYDYRAEHIPSFDEEVKQLKNTTSTCSPGGSQRN